MNENKSTLIFIPLLIHCALYQKFPFRGMDITKDNEYENFIVDLEYRNSCY